jgi:hypothetical protein
MRGKATLVIVNVRISVATAALVNVAVTATPPDPRL